MIPAKALLDFFQDKNCLYQRLSTSRAGRSFSGKAIILGNTKLADFFWRSRCVGLVHWKTRYESLIRYVQQEQMASCQNISGPRRHHKSCFSVTTRPWICHSYNLVDIYRYLISATDTWKIFSTLTPLLSQYFGSQNCKDFILQQLDLSAEHR